MANSTSFDLLLHQLRDYLESHGIDSTKHVCLRPDHDDSTPSAHVYDTNIWCYGCSRSMSIFDAAHFLEGFPARGTPMFYQGNVLMLAKRFGIKLPLATEDDSVSLLNALVNYTIGPYLDKVAAEQGRSPEEVLQDSTKDGWGIHTALAETQKREQPASIRLPPYQECLNFLMGKGFTREQVLAAGVGQKLIAYSNQLCLPLWVAKGICGGLQTRNERYEEDRYGPKYMFTYNNNIWTKSSYVYGIADIPRKREGDDDFIQKHTFVLEGIKDCLAVRMAGYLSTTTLNADVSLDQIDELIAHKQMHLCFAFDPDKAGLKGMLKGCERAMRRGLFPSVLHWPNERDAFEHLVLVNPELSADMMEDGVAFWVRWKKNEYQGEVTLVARDAVDILLDVPSHIARGELAQAIAQNLQVNHAHLLADCDAEELQRRNASYKSDLQIYKNAMHQAEEHPENTSVLFNKAHRMVQYNQGARIDFSKSSLISKIQRMESGDADLSEHDVLFREQGLGFLSNLLHKEGLGYTQGTLAAIGGDPHTGKTALAIQIGTEWLMGSDNSILLYFATDDHEHFLLPRFISCMIMDPRFYSFYAGSTALEGSDTFHLYRKRQRAYARLIEYIRTDRFVMIDKTTTGFLADVSVMARRLRDKYPDAPIMIMNDNMCQNADFADMDENSQLSMTGEMGKELAINSNLTFWGPVQYRKNRPFGRPVNSDIAGRADFQYHCNIIIHLHNDFAKNNGHLPACSYAVEIDGQLIPRVSLELAKNKVSGKLGRYILNLWSRSTFFSWTDQVAALGILKMRDQQLYPEKYDDNTGKLKRGKFV